MRTQRSFFAPVSAPGFHPTLSLRRSDVQRVSVEAGVKGITSYARSIGHAKPGKPVHQQEDHFSLGDRGDALQAGVFDGMGGTQLGDVIAEHAAINTLHESFSHNLRPEALGPVVDTITEGGMFYDIAQRMVPIFFSGLNHILRAFIKANRDRLDANKPEPGTTGVVTYGFRTPHPDVGQRF